MKRSYLFILRPYRYFGDSFCGGIFLGSRSDVIKAHMTRSCINSIFGYAPAIALFNRPWYSSAMSAFNDGFKSLRCPTRTVASGGWMVTEGESRLTLCREVTAKGTADSGNKSATVSAT